MAALFPGMTNPYEANKDAIEAHRGVGQDNAGKFGNYKAAGNEGLAGSLSGPGDPLLDDALARYGLRPGDVPGLQDAWAEQFSVLDDPIIPTTEEVLSGFLGDMDFGRLRGGPRLVVIDEARSNWDDDYQSDYVPGARLAAGERVLIEVYTRNGGGNRECWCDSEDGAHDDGCLQAINDNMERHPAYVFDSDDLFDSTYASFYFEPTPDVIRAHDGAYRDRFQGARQRRAQALLDQIEAGTVPPWRVLATTDQVNELAGQKEAVKRGLLDDWNSKQLDLKDAEARKQLAVLNGDAEDDTPNRRFQTFAAAGRELGQATATKEQFDEIRRSIPSLPEAVREYLDGTLPEQTMTHREGRRTVKTTYTPKTDFQSKEDLAQRKFASASATFAKYEGEARAVMADVAERRRRDAEAREALAGIARQEWSLGWPGRPDDLPEPPPSE